MSLSFDDIYTELSTISDECSNVHYFIDDDDSLTNALDGDEEEAFEFKMAFADLEAKCDLLYSAIQDVDYDVRSNFDDYVVSLIGNRYKLLGYDSVEEDYFALTGYEIGLAESEAAKRVIRHTKAEMLSTIGQCMGIVLAYLDLRQSYDYLKATLDILRDENTSLLDQIQRVEQAYEDYMTDGTNYRSFDALLSALPDRTWIE